MGAEPVSEDPVLPPTATAADVAGRWLQASAACNRAAAAALEFLNPKPASGLQLPFAAALDAALVALPRIGS